MEFINRKGKGIFIVAVALVVIFTAAVIGFSKTANIANANLSPTTLSATDPRYDVTTTITGVDRSEADKDQRLYLEWSMTNALGTPTQAELDKQNKFVAGSFHAYVQDDPTQIKKFKRVEFNVSMLQSKWHLKPGDVATLYFSNYDGKPIGPVDAIFDGKAFFFSADQYAELDDYMWSYCTVVCDKSLEPKPIPPGPVPPEPKHDDGNISPETGLAFTN